MRRTTLGLAFFIACSPTDDDLSMDDVDFGSTGGQHSNETGSSLESTETGDPDTTGEEDSGAPSCNPPPPHEPNDVEDDAHVLPEFHTDCDENSSVMGVLAGEDDEDWYVYRGDASSLFCLIDPTAWVNASGDVRLCQFADCVGDVVPDPQCPGGVLKTTSEDGRAGCCTARDSQIPDLTMSWGCGSGDHLVYIRVDQGDAGVCTSYTLGYHF